MASLKDPRSCETFFTERQKQKKMETQLYRDRKKSECPDEVGAQSVTAKQEDIFNRPANANQVQFFDI